jgi:Uncharacterized protein conserved in bacteria (DUF2066)
MVGKMVGLSDRRTSAGLVVAVVAVGVASIGAAIAAPGDKIYTVGNYPVEARANDAVAARTRAIADGQKAALRSLIKRLVPVTAYARARKVSVEAAPRMVDSLSVRTERNSPTEYSGSLDFKFQPQAVRALLEREGLPFADRQAEVVTIVPIWRAPADTPDMPAALGPTQGPKAWTDAWKSLDLEHALTPVKLDVLKLGTHADTLKALAAGDAGFWRTFASGYTSERLVAAIAEPDIGAKRLNVTLIGQDATGAIAWQRAYRLDLSDPAYAVELAGVVSLGVLEGRWKSVTVKGGPIVAASPASYGASGSSAAPTAGAAADFTVNVEFRGMAEWQEMSRTLSDTPGIENLDVLGMSGRGARITLRYPGGGARLAEALASQGLTLRNTGNGWSLTGR